MRLYYILLLFIVLSGMFSCLKPQHKSNVSTPQIPQFDSVKAVQLGADEYGMKTYVMAFLKRGPNSSLDSVHKGDLQQAHLKNIQNLAEKGKLVLAGPFLDNGEIRGIYIFDVPTIDEARKLTETDPAIKAGILTMELKPWYGSAALLELNALHTAIQKRSITNE